MLSRSRLPPKVPLLPLRSQKSAAGPRALCVLRPGSPPPPRTARAALWGLPLPWVRPAPPRSPRRPGGALPQRRALRAASGIGVTSGWRRLPVPATLGSVRPGGSAAQSPPSNLPPPPPRLGLVGPALTSRPARSEGGGREGPLPASASAQTRAALSGSVPPPRVYRVLSRPEHQTLVCPCTWPSAPRTWARVERLGRRGKKLGAPGRGVKGPWVKAPEPR